VSECHRRREHRNAHGQQLGYSSYKHLVGRIVCSCSVRQLDAVDSRPKHLYELPIRFTKAWYLAINGPDHRRRFRPVLPNNPKDRMLERVRKSCFVPLRIEHLSSHVRSSNNTLCVSTVLTDLQTSLGQSLSLNTIIQDAPQIAANPQNISKGVLCNECTEGLCRPHFQ
jgi:hypothetical protein